MKLFQLRKIQQLPISLKDAWDFFSNPSNLSKITPPSMKFEITNSLPEQIYPGMMITYKVNPLPYWRITWVTEITHVTDKSLFVDEQRMGPYKLWHHEHHFRELADGVEMEDIVSYILPFRILGTVFQPIISKRLDHIFTYRQECLEKITYSIPYEKQSVTS